MYKQILGYIPSNIVPAIFSFATIYAYTRMLTPASFGDFNFVFSAVLLLQTSLYLALPVAITRFHPGADLAGRGGAFLREAYSAFYGISVVVAVAGLAAGLLTNIAADYRALAWLALPLLLCRSAVAMNQAVNRATNKMGRFNLVECAHAFLGLAVGLIFVFVVGPEAKSAVLGLLVAAILCACIDIRVLAAPFRRDFGVIDRTALTQLLAYAWPLVTVAIAAAVLQLSDRFMLGTLGSAEVLGIYAVAFSLVDRPTLLICTSISTATFSIAVQELEHRGRDAGRIQAGKNGAVLLALALPACIGLALTAPQIAAVMVGPQFRTGVAALIPIMCFTALFRGVRGHFLDHAFHLAGRSDMMLLSYAPAAAADVVINLIVVPRYGMFGAAWTALGCQGLAVVTGWVIGRRVFPIWLPARQVFKILAAIVPMAGILGLIDFSRDWGGLLAAVGLGAAVYAASAVLLDVGGIRPMAWAWLLGRRIRRARPRLPARSARWRLPVHPPRS